jgi:putative FmdB family regulatory protein
MPIYTYRCASCGDRDVRQSITAEALTECVECKAPVRKVITAPGITFIGSGFYGTDSVPAPPKKARAPKRP